MEIIGQLNESIIICVNNSTTTTTTTSTDTSLSSSSNNSRPSFISGSDESKNYFKQLFLLNLNDSSIANNYEIINTTNSNKTPATLSSTTSVNSNSFKNSSLLHPFVLLSIPKYLNYSNNNTQISQVSLVQLVKKQQQSNSTLAEASCFFPSSDEDFLPSGTSSDDKLSYSLMTVVYVHRLGQQDEQYLAYLYLLETTILNSAGTGNSSSNKLSSKTTIIESLELIKEQKLKLHVHILPCDNPDPVIGSNLSYTPLATPTPSGSYGGSFLNRILVLHLQESITIYRIETTPLTPLQSVSTKVCTKIEILSSDSIPKAFCWAQWNPTFQFLAFTHKQKLRLSPVEFDGDYNRSSSSRILDMGILSVYQFHANYPRESVLNFPLPKYQEEILTTKQEFFKQSYTLVSNPFVLTNSIPNPQQQLRMLATAAGIVYLFQLIPLPSALIGTSADDTLKYTVNVLHHNKTVHGRVSNGTNRLANSIKVDLCMIMNGQFLLIVGWPLFIHILDAGAEHEPSHNLIFDLNSIHCFLPTTTSTLINKEPSSYSLAMLLEFSSAVVQEKENILEKSTKQFSFNLIFNNNSGSSLNANLQIHNVIINSTFLLPLVKSSDIQFKLSVLHFLLIHLGDFNAAKRIIYDAGQTVENVWLSKLFQEFIVANSFSQTKRSLSPKLKSFHYLLPYCPFTNKKNVYEGANYRTEVKPSLVQVSTMLLSPNQRIFPHTSSDLWTTLWELNGLLTKNKRFSHKTISDKLLLSLQCYKPEVLSRTTTPMSPLSPMIWSASSTLSIASTNGGSATSSDLSSPFGRRQELLLPFVEHESCTANKQEFIYSINLRELSVHILKERKDCPVHGHAISGRYINALVDNSRLLCHLICLIVQLNQRTKNRDKGFRLIDSLSWDTKLRLFLLFEHFSLGMSLLACPFPNGFTSFFAYLGYRVLKYDQFLWHVRSGSFDLQIDVVKSIMADMSDSDPTNVQKKFHLISLLSKSRACRVLSSWSHPSSICIRARQHSADLLNGSLSSSSSSQQQQQSRRTNSAITTAKIHHRIKLNKGEANSNFGKVESGPLETFYKLLSAKANPSEIDLGLLTEATVISMRD